MSNIILFHGDLDGLYSGLLFYHTNKNELDIHEVRSIEYGQDHSTLYDQFDEFFIFDFADNPGQNKTTLWVDHHLRQGENGAEFHLVEEAPSCVRLMIRKGLVDDGLISDEDAKCIDIVDSAGYEWSDDFSQEDLIMPDPDKSRLNKFVVLNQLLRKNRKNGLCEKLFEHGALDVDRVLELVQHDRGPKTTKYDLMMEVRQHLLEKMIRDTDKYIKYFSDVPVLFTKEFSQKDWKGYDLNLLGYLANKSPYLIVVFDFRHEVNIQITRNVFFNGEVKPVYPIIKSEVDDPRGHEGILNMTFPNTSAAIEKMDAIIGLLADHI